MWRRSKNTVCLSLSTNVEHAGLWVLLKWMSRGFSELGYDVKILDKPTKKRCKTVFIGNVEMLKEWVDVSDVAYIFIEGPLAKVPEWMEKTDSVIVAPSFYVWNKLVDAGIKPSGIVYPGLGPSCITPKRLYDVGFVFSYRYDHPCVLSRKGVDLYTYVVKKLAGFGISVVTTKSCAKSLSNPTWWLTKSGKTVEYVHTVSNPAEVYSMSRVFLYLARSEGFGQPPLEAMWCGTPVVYLDAPAYNEFAVGWKIPSRYRGYCRFTEHMLLDQYEPTTLDGIIDIVTHALDEYEKYVHKAFKAAEKLNYVNMAQGLAKYL